MEYILEADGFLWLYPFCEILGIAFQLLAIFLKSLSLFLSAVVLIAFGAFMEKDIVLFTGDCLISLALWLSVFRKK